MIEFKKRKVTEDDFINEGDFILSIPVHLHARLVSPQIEGTDLLTPCIFKHAENGQLFIIYGTQTQGLISSVEPSIIDLIDSLGTIRFPDLKMEILYYEGQSMAFDSINGVEYVRVHSLINDAIEMFIDLYGDIEFKRETWIDDWSTAVWDLEFVDNTEN